MNILTDYPLQIEQDVIWGDMDAFNHVNNSVYFRYFEDVRMVALAQIGALDYMQAHNIGPILANARCDFRRPLNYPDRITIGLGICDLSVKKFTMTFAVYSQQQQAVAAEGDGLIVYYDYSRKGSCEVPQSLASALERLKKS